MGVTPHYTKCGLSNEKDILRKPKSKYELANDTFLSTWHPFLKAEMQELKPDVVVSDYASCAGALIATELGVPSVINYTFPLKKFGFDGQDIINMNETTSCCGMICIRRSCMRGFIEFFFRTMPYFK